MTTQQPAGTRRGSCALLIATALIILAIGLIMHG
jgi:hypothetical protein